MLKVLEIRSDNKLYRIILPVWNEEDFGKKTAHLLECSSRYKILVVYTVISMLIVLFGETVYVRMFSLMHGN